MIEYIITGEPQRTERFDYPLDAIREIVVNMIVHRDYRDSSGSIIKIYDDRIEFYNPGKLYGGITIHDLLSENYTSKSRNKLIARAFKEVGLIERYGSGIIRVRKICKDYGIKEPLFREISQGFEVILYKNTDKNKEIVTDKYKEIFTDKDTDSVVDNVVDNVVESVVENETNIIQLLKQNKGFSANELAQTLNKSERTIQRYLNSLIKKKIIIRIGPDKGGYWKVNINY
jgi:ATP-dependent DNA helicase RecG